jgi:hypothetical protein
MSGSSHIWPNDAADRARSLSPGARHCGPKAPRFSDFVTKLGHIYREYRKAAIHPQ